VWVARRLTAICLWTQRYIQTTGVIYALTRTWNWVFDAWFQLTFMEFTSSWSLLTASLFLWHSFVDLRNILESATTRILLQKAEQLGLTWCKVGDLRWVFETLPFMLLQKFCRLEGCVATWHQVTSVLPALWWGIVVVTDDETDGKFKKLSSSSSSFCRAPGS